MSSTLLSLLFDGTLALLLVVTISYCSKLNKKIRQLQDSRSELAEMISRFDASTERATHSLAELQGVSKKITEALQIKIDKANFLADDLAFLIEKSSKLATHLEQLQKHSVQVARPTVPPPAPPAFIAAERPPHAKPAPEPLSPRPAQTGNLSTASIEAMLQKLSAPLQGRQTTPASGGARTQAERELLSALKPER